MMPVGTRDYNDDTDGVVLITLVIAAVVGFVGGLALGFIIWGLPWVF